MHIDATLTPLKPGLVLINPLRVPPALREELKAGLFKGWDLVEVPEPAVAGGARHSTHHRAGCGPTCGSLTFARHSGGAAWTELIVW